MWQQALAILVALGLGALLVRQAQIADRKRKSAPFAFFAEAAGLLNEPRISSGETAGSMVMTGNYRQHGVQVKAITDTLALRKLPSLWLLVTLPGELPVKAMFDLMMRPAGPTTFSNFDHLPATVTASPDFPIDAVIRSDDPANMLPQHVVVPHLEPFFGNAAKELLITPNGLRMVVLLAQADRARYGVFRQAEFGDIVLQAAQLDGILVRLLALRDDILKWHGST